MAIFIRLRGYAAVLLAILCGCTQPQSPAASEAEEETIARTEFTSRVENFFEYLPLKVNRPSFFRIHLTDLADGAPVAMAQVTLTAKAAGSSQTAAETTAKTGKVTGIYVAELLLKEPGAYAIEFRIRNEKLDERMPLSGFIAE